MRKLLFLFFAVSLFIPCLAQVKIERPLTESRTDPIDIDVLIPRFSWQLFAGDKRGVMQAAYEIRAGKNYEDLKHSKHLVWNSRKVVSDQSVYIPYGGEPLASGQRYYWQVRVWDNLGKMSEWSEPAFWQMGLLKPADWAAKWIAPGFVEDSVTRPSPLFRKEFSLSKKIRSAMAYITAHGLY